MIINFIVDMVIIVGVGIIIFQLYLFVTMTRLKRAKKWTAKKEARLQQMIVTMRAIVAILMVIASMTFAVRIFQNI